MSNFLKNWNKFLEEGDYQKELHSPSELARHDRNNLAKKGGAKSSAPFTEEPPKGRAKSAPPGFGGLEEAEETIDEHIVKKDGKYCLMSKKTNKNLGCYDTKAGAEKRERQVQYFKHMGEGEVEEDILFDPLTKKQKAHSSKLIRIKYKDKPLDKDGIIDPKVAKAEKESLNEIKMEQVVPRFQSKAFINAIDQMWEKLKNSPYYKDSEKFTPQQMQVLIEDLVPTGIPEKDKPEALNWLITAFIQTPELPSTFVRRDLDTFYKIKKVKMDKILRINDIYKIKDDMELFNVVREATPAWEKYQESVENKKADVGTNRIYEDDEWEVFIPENKGAACKLGKGTRWCTAAPGLKHYEHYHSKEDPLIIFVSKTETYYNEDLEKVMPVSYQFSYGVQQFMDVDNQNIRDRKDNRLFYKLNAIVQKIDKLPRKVRELASEFSSSVQELPYGGYKTVQENGDTDYYDKDGLHHREDGPAMILYEKDKIALEKWYIHGQLHREDGPAVTYYLLGIREWYKDDVLHREDGPAYENDKWDRRAWYLFGEELPYYKWEDEVKRRYSNLQEMIVQELHNLINEKKDRCYRIAKRKYKAFPSAYASGAIVKCRQGKIWKKEK